MDLPTKEELELLEKRDPELFKKLVRSLRQDIKDRETPAYVEGLFLPQRKFFEDPSKKKAACCSRRAGKSDGLAAWLLDGGRDDPGGMSVYIAVSRNLCRLIMWAALHRLNDRYDLGLQFKELDNQLYCVLPNKHRIWMAGCKDSAEVDKFRGPFYRRAAVDEAQSYGPYIKTLVEDVLQPALMDLGGEICLTGTPGPVPAGYFYDICTGSNTTGDTAQWSAHNWTMVQNPHIQLNRIPKELQMVEIDAANKQDYHNARSIREMEEKLESNGWDRNHPTFRREWLGQWVKDLEALVYPYDPKKNRCFKRDLPEDEGDRWTYTLGIDIGVVDATAFIVAGMRRGYPEIYVVYAEKKVRMTPQQVAVHIEKLKERFDIKHVVMDTGGIGKGYQEEAQRHFKLKIEPAEKSKKRAFIEIVYGQLISGNIKIDPHEAFDLVQEMGSLVWEDDRRVWSDKFDDHACFPAGTTVETPSGPKFIEDIRPGDDVLTHSHTRRTLATCRTEKQSLFEVTFSNGQTLHGTKRHPVATSNGWKALGELQPGDECWQFDSTARSIVGTQTQSGENSETTTPQDEGSGFTLRCGSGSPGGLGLMGVTSTTSTATLSTMTLATWSVLAASTISLSTQAEALGASLLSRAKRLLSGTGAKRGALGTGSTRRTKPRDGEKNSAVVSAKVVDGSSTRHILALSSATENAKRDGMPGLDGSPVLTWSGVRARNAGRASLSAGIAPKGTVPVRVVSVRKLNQRADVYSLTVDGEGTHFAGGVVVRNCDAFTYTIRQLVTNYNPQVIPRELSHREQMDKLVAEHKAKCANENKRKFRRSMRKGLRKSALGKSIARGKDMW